LSTIGPAGLPARKFEICNGSSGRPGCSTMACRRSTKGTTGGGGAVLVINLGAAAGGTPATLGTVLTPGSTGTGLPAFGTGAVGRMTGGTGARPAATAGAIGPRPPLAVRGIGRTGGGVTGLPGLVAFKVGFTGGCGSICALAICSGGTRTTLRKTGCPPLKTVCGTTVVATVRYA
jgi:hypothetical protein